MTGLSALAPGALREFRAAARRAEATPSPEQISAAPVIEWWSAVVNRHGLVALEGRVAPAGGWPAANVWSVLFRVRADGSAYASEGWVRLGSPMRETDSAALQTMFATLEVECARVRAALLGGAP